MRWSSFSPAGILLPPLTLMRSLQCATCSKGMWLFILSNRLGLTERQENSTGKKKSGDWGNKLLQCGECCALQKQEGHQNTTVLQTNETLKKMERSWGASALLRNTPKLNKYPCLFKGTNTDHSTGFALVPFTHTVAVMENNWLATNNDTGWGMKGCNLQIPPQKPQFFVKITSFYNSQEAGL